MARHTIRSAAALALEVLTTIQSLDADNGITDPDVAEAVAALAQAIGAAGTNARAATVRAYRRPNRWGFRPHESLQIVSGPRAGSDARYVSTSSSSSIYVVIDGVRRVVNVKFVERMAA